MKYLLVSLIIFSFSCGEHTSVSENANNSKDSLPTDSMGLTNATNVTHEDSLTASLNNQLKTLFDGKFQLLTDEHAQWNKKDMDSIILPARQRDPYYPIIAKGDFNWDGKLDVAAIVKDTQNTIFRVAILLNSNKAILWPQDVKGAGIEKYVSPDAKKLKGKGNQVVLEGDGILVQSFKTTSYVIYWNGKEFDRAWTGD